MQDVIHVQIWMFFLWCCLRAVWTPLFTSTCPICLIGLARRVSRPVWIGPQCSRPPKLLFFLPRIGGRISCSHSEILGTLHHTRRGNNNAALIVYGQAGPAQEPDCFFIKLRVSSVERKYFDNAFIKQPQRDVWHEDFDQKRFGHLHAKWCERRGMYSRIYTLLLSFAHNVRSKMSRKVLVCLRHTRVCLNWFFMRGSHCKSIRGSRYRWVPINPNMDDLNSWWIRSPMKVICRSLFCKSPHLIRMIFTWYRGVTFSN